MRYIVTSNLPILGVIVALWMVMIPALFAAGFLKSKGMPKRLRLPAVTESGESTRFELVASKPYTAIEIGKDGLVLEDAKKKASLGWGQIFSVRLSRHFYLSTGGGSEKRTGWIWKVLHIKTSEKNHKIWLFEFNHPDELLQRLNLYRPFDTAPVSFFYAILTVAFIFALAAQLVPYFD